MLLPLIEKWLWTSIEDLFWLSKSSPSVTRDKEIGQSHVSLLGKVL